MRVTGLDHIVLRVSDVERSLAWYTGVLGLAGERVDEWRSGSAPFPSVRLDEATIIDLFATDLAATDLSATDGSPLPAGSLDHFCLVLPAADWEEMVASGSIPVERGPSEVFGARGMGRSIYTSDPDGVVVELRRY